MIDESFRFDIPTLQTRRAEPEPVRDRDSQSPEVESHLTRLLNFWNRLQSISDRASGSNSPSVSSSQDFELLAIAGLKEAECADRIEQGMETDLTNLCEELRQKDETLRVRETALARLEETSKATLAELQNHIRIQENQLQGFEEERQQWTSERDQLINRLKAVELSGERSEASSPVSLRISHTEDCEDSAAASESNLHNVEGDHDVKSLHLRLQDAEGKLLSQEKMLEEKETGIHAATLREKELGKLIERLSSECENLSAELCEKELIISRFEATRRDYRIGRAKLREQVLRAVQAGRRLYGHLLSYSVR